MVFYKTIVIFSTNDDDILRYLQH